MSTARGGGRSGREGRGGKTFQSKAMLPPSLQYGISGYPTSNAINALVGDALATKKSSQSHCSRCGSFCNHRNLHFQFHNQFLQEPSSLHQSGDNWTSCLPILPTILRKSNYPKVLISSFIGQKFQDILTNTKNHHLLGQRSTIFTLRVDATKFM